MSNSGLCLPGGTGISVMLHRTSRWHPCPSDSTFLAANVSLHGTSPWHPKSNRSQYDDRFYGASIMDADVIMIDGKSLEHTGVISDELLRPSPGDMAANRDPVMVRAAELLGVKLDPVKAGAMFLIEWK